MLRAQPRVEAGRRRAGVRRPPRLRAGRRPPLPRLEPVRPARAAGAAPVPGGRRPADRRAGRRQRVDGRRQPAQAGSGAADRRRAGVRRPREPGSRRGHPARRRRRRRSLPPARGKGAILPILRLLDGVRAGGARRAGGGGARVPVAPAPAAARAGDRDLRLLRSGRPPRGAGSAAPPPAGGGRHPGERARRSWRPTLRGDVELRDVETGERAS